MTLNGQVVDNYSPAVQPDDPKAGTVHGGGIEWTIKDGVPYHVPTLTREVKDRSRPPGSRSGSRDPGRKPGRRNGSVV